MTSGSVEPVFTKEQHDQLVEILYYEYIKKKKLSKMGVRGIAKELHDRKDGDGNYVFYDSRGDNPDKTKLGSPETFRKNIDRIVQHWKRELLPFLKYNLIEGVAEQAEKSADSPASLKAVASIIEPADDKTSDKPAISPGAVTILQRNGVGTIIRIGQDALPTGVGYQGHECPDSGDIVADGQQEILVPEALPPGHDTPFRGVPSGEDTAQGTPVPDTPVPPEDPVDNDGGGGVGSP